jgi:hypothetical protein
MNIFVTSNCPKKCAEYLDNKRVVKMVLETAQLLSTALAVHNGPNPYKATHKNHPAAVWARKTRSNYLWTLKHFLFLCEEYTKRYNKIHKCQQYYSTFLDNAEVIPAGPQSPFANCAANKSLGICYKHVKNTTKAYKLYLTRRWQSDKLAPKWR